MFNKMKDLLFPTTEDAEEIMDKISKITREDIAKAAILILGLYLLFIAINPQTALVVGIIVFAHIGAVASVVFILHRTYLYISGKKPKNFFWDSYSLDDYIMSLLIPVIIIFPLCVFLLHICYGA